MTTPLVTLDWEEGTDGGTLAAGGDISAVNGVSTYSAAAAKHGALGLTGVGNNTQPTFTVPRTAAFTDANQSATVSLYVNPVTVPGGAIKLCEFQNSLNALIGSVRMHSDGHFDLALTSRLAATALTWQVGTWYRLDLRYDGSTQGFTLDVFAGANVEGTVPDETITATGTVRPGGLDHLLMSVGRASTVGCQCYMDTVRFYDGAVVADPFAPPAPDTTAPSVPAGVTATADGTSQVTVDWSASTDDVAVASYRVRRDGADLAGAGAVAGLSYVDTTVAPGGTYSYTVSAVDAAGNRSAESAAAVVTTPSGAGTVDHLWAGAPTSDGFTVAAKLTGATSVRMAVSTSASMTAPVYVGPVVPDSAGYVKLTATGLPSATQHYYQLADTPSGGSEQLVGAVGRAKTLPAAGQPAGFTFALASCITNDAADPTAMDDLRTWAPDFHVFTGDFHYKGLTSTVATDHVAGYEQQIAGAAGLAALIRDVPMIYCTSDHEAGPDNGDSDNTYTQASIDAYKQVVPHLPLADTRTPTVGRYQTWTVGRVRFILLDIRNTDRSPGAGADGPGKTMLGATQKQWLKDRLLDPEPVKVIVSDVAWMGPASITNGEDKWWSYDTERQELIDFIAAHGVRVVLMHGDSHLLGCTAPANNTWGLFPVYAASPLHNVGGGRNQTTFDQSYTNGGLDCRQYGRVTVTDDGNTIAFAFSGWDATADLERVAQVDSFTVGATSTRKVKVGGTDVDAVFLGPNGVLRMYVGAGQVWP